MMDNHTPLLKKRAELKDEITLGLTKTPMARLFNITDHIIRTITRRRQPNPWAYTAAILAIIIWLPGFLIAALLGEMDQFGRLGWMLSIVLELFLLVVIGTHLNIGNFLVQVRDYLIDAIESGDDLNDLQHWLAEGWSTLRFRSFILLFIGIAGIGCTILGNVMWGGFTGFGIMTTMFIASFFGGISFYYAPLMLSLTFRLSRYHYRLYQIDPAHSEIIGRLSRMLNTYVYGYMVMNAMITFILAANPLTVFLGFVIVIFFGWPPATIQFICNQRAIGKIVTTAKWKTLNELQARVNTLLTESNLSNKETRETIDGIVKYHELIQAKRDSALNFGEGLSFFNQLMLPVLGLVLANLELFLRLLKLIP